MYTVADQLVTITQGAAHIGVIVRDVQDFDDLAQGYGSGTALAHRENGPDTAIALQEG